LLGQTRKGGIKMKKIISFIPAVFIFVMAISFADAWHIIFQITGTFIEIVFMIIKAFIDIIIGILIKT